MNAECEVISEELGLKLENPTSDKEKLQERRAKLAGVDGSIIADTAKNEKKVQRRWRYTQKISRSR